MKLLRKKKNKLYCLGVITSPAAGTESAVTQSFAERRASFSCHKLQSLAAFPQCHSTLCLFLLPSLSRCPFFFFSEEVVSDRKLARTNQCYCQAGCNGRGARSSPASHRDTGCCPEQSWCLSRWHCESCSPTVGLFCSKR